MSESKLHVIIPYFNHTNARANRRNLELCLRNLSLNSDCRIVLVEGIWNRDSQLPDFSDRIFRHLTFGLGGPLWVKENLINLGIKSLGDDWQYAAWIDKDIQFLNPDWATETMRKLEEVDILQPWSRVLFLNSRYEVKDSSPHVHSLQKYQGAGESGGLISFCRALSDGDSNGGHPGNAWAAKKSFFNKIGKLFDQCVVGGGDSVLVACLDTRYKCRDPDRAANFGVFLNEYTPGFNDVTTGWVNGTILHHHHGEMEKRNYLGRYGLLRKHGFNAESQLSYDANGTLKLANAALEKAILDFFVSREEHLVP